MELDITYRGPLSSCNYDCGYCPFAKTFDDAQTRRKDKAAIERFCDWVTSRSGTDELRILFTPWGEALVRSWYRRALVRLSRQPHVRQVVIQTNMSVATDWLRQADLNTLSLWITYHPSQISLEQFMAKVRELDTLGVRYSVGIVGTREHQAVARQLRQQLNPAVYLWVNAYKDEPSYYQPEDIAFYRLIDPWFELNLQDYPSENQSCHAAVTAVSVDGDGDVYPCHFVKQTLGNLYQTELHQLLQPGYFCPNFSCNCYIGYIHLQNIKPAQVFGKNKFERIPVQWEQT
ncbi:hypothetical protein VQ7734_00894 [Vibrio quintilis]|uniref:Radical SAM protein n=2 Tax=Vibrio quintilis TaxID=1117707 RepID=A0A1M7YRH4_9VIBR|nr:hypothetical protein VQ7734_00894 [Vibrio quintilis]